MTFKEYQKKAITTDLLGNGTPVDVTHPAFIAKILGLVGEAGEVAEKFKKIVRDKEGKVNETDRIELKKELGDVLWYISALSQYLGISLEDVATGNLDKVLDRKARGVSHGSGDNR